MLDACVLVQAPLRDTLLRLAEEPGLYRPFWSAEIMSETMRTLHMRLGLSAAKAAYLESEIRKSFPRSYVAGFEALIPSMQNDAKDRHVLAAAVRAGAESIVTFNTRHFPAEALSPWGIEVLHPDDFLQQLLHTAPDIVHERVTEQAVNLGRTIDRQLEVLERTVPRFVGGIRTRIHSG